jgi:putative transcriptional regulator
MNFTYRFLNAIMCCVMIHNRMAVLRAEKGMSRQKLAERIGVNYQTIGFIERGDYFPSLELAFSIARVFGVEVTTVFSDRPFPPLFAIKGGTNES